jgi:hypothetical protein
MKKLCEACGAVIRSGEVIDGVTVCDPCIDQANQNETPTEGN